MFNFLGALLSVKNQRMPIREEAMWAPVW